MLKYFFVGLLGFMISINVFAAKWEGVAGSVVAHSSASTQKYLGSPSLCVLEDGTYVASHDFFGPKSNEFISAQTDIYQSKDKGLTWEKISSLNQFWSGLFYHNGALWLMGARNNADDCVIRKSLDGGKTWTEPADENSGLLLKREKSANGEYGYHTAPCAVVVANGRIWRAMEFVPRLSWGDFAAFVMSAPIDADLLKASSWTITNKIKFPIQLKGITYWTWLEGNVIKEEKSGKIYNMLRVEGATDDIAAIIEVSNSGESAVFKQDNGFVRMPGANKKFVPRYDASTKKYYSLTNYIPEEYRKTLSPGGVRNTLALVESDDMRTWRATKILLQSDDVKYDGFQYVDWAFDGDDIIFLSRTAFFDGKQKAHNNHDSNFITFHRVKYKNEKK